MKQLRLYFFILFPVIVSLILFSTAGSTSAASLSSEEAEPSQTSSSPSAQEAVERAWELAHESGRYAFRTDMLQTTEPANRLENAGRDKRIDRLHMEGEADRIEKTLSTEMWRAGFEEQTIAVRVVNGKTYGRVGLNEWAEVDGYADMFAPAGDPMSFLAGAANIQLAGEETRRYTQPDGSELSLAFTRYTFDVDGYAFADYVKRDLEATLHASGELPQGISLSASDVLQNATGQGEIWLNEEGLPSYLAIDLEFPRQPNGDEVTAEIQTEFRDYNMERLTAAQTGLIENPSVWVTHRLPTTAADQNQLIAAALLLFAFCALALWVKQNWGAPVIYNSVAVLVTTSMVMGPLLQSSQVDAFYDDQLHRHTEMQAEQDKVEREQDMENVLRETDFNPHSDPFSTPSDFAIQKEIAAHGSDSYLIESYGFSEVNTVQLQTTTPITSTDTDGDGLTDADELYWQSCAYVGAPSFCMGITDSTDSDGDGLSDGSEVNLLGTEPSIADTDSDTIPDNLEVTGFTDSNNVLWHLDPKESDSNKDGLSDGVECRVWVVDDPSYDVTAACPDTDNDGDPDVFDSDNDNDGIPDDVDLSPFAPDATTYNQDNKLKVQFNNLTTNIPTYFNIQMIPTTRENLTLLGNVYNWPAGDNNGQIQRVLDTTWADVSDTSIRSTASNAGDGDLRVVPFLEIYIPYQEGHYGNLPIKPAYQNIARTQGITVSQWLDDSELRQFGISVSDVDATSGDLQVLVPLNLVSDSQGSGPVAFNAKMLYDPTQGTNNIADWGNAHEMRLVWLVQMITDSCPAANLECADNERVEQLSIVHIYDDSWQLGGIATDQDFGLDVALLYEDPAIDNDRKVDDYLWAGSAFLSNAFIRGIDCPVIAVNSCDANAQDGQRDVTIDNAVSAIDSWSGGTSNIAGVNFSYPHEAYITHIWVTETISLLDTHFASYQDEDLTPTIMTLKEGTKQGVNLEEATVSSGTVTFDFDDTKVPKFTVVSMNWATYYDADDGPNVQWDNYDLESYLELLDFQLLNETYFQAGSNSLNDRDASKGKRFFAQLYYQAMYRGTTGVVEADGVLTWLENPSIPEAGFNPGFPTSTWRGTTYVTILFVVSALKTIGTKIGFTSTALEFWTKFGKAFGKQFSSIYKQIFSAFANTRGLQLFTAGAFGVATVLIGIGLLLLAAGVIFQNEGLKKAAVIVLNISSVIVLSLWLSSVVYASVTLYKLGYSIATLTTIFKGFNLFGPVGFIFAVVLPIIFVLVAWATGQIGRPGDIEFTMAFVTVVAQVIVAVLLLVITVALGVFGAILAFFILIIDGVLAIFGIQKGISAWLTDFFAKAVYKTDELIFNMSDPDRLGIGLEGTGLSNPEKGFAVSNSLFVTTVVTTTLDTRTRAYDVVNPKKAEDTTRFRYSLTQSEISANDNTDNNWIILPEYRVYEPPLIPGQPIAPEYWFYIQDVQTIKNTMAVPFSAIGTGINISLTNNLYLNEYYRVPYEGCWRILFKFGCAFYTTTNDTHIPLGDYFTFDILPNTVNDFVNFNVWNSAGSIPFPTQVDQDNDGLLSINAGGTDTDDTQADRDGDGLDDAFEQRHGLDENKADTDGDGLNDSEELTYYTNPLRADSDGDGLTDYTEVVTGWLVPYDDNGHTTRIWSDPNVADFDNDSLTDLEEFIFATNPWTATDPSILRTLVTFDGLGVVEKSAPLVYLPFEETIDRGFFSDESGYGLRFTCDQTNGACPAAAQTGQIGRAADFDGNDQLHLLGQTLNIGPELTLAAWINPDTIPSSGFQRIITVGSEKAVLRIENQKLDFYVKIDGVIHHVLVPNVLQTGVYQHVAGTYDGEMMRVYHNGVEVGSRKMLGSVDNSGAVRINHTNEAFDGRLDEVAIFDIALSDTQIRELMTGRYNANDLIVPPGSELSYSATVTNSHPTLGAAGQLVATSHYAQPAIPEPDMVLNFEPEDYVVTVPNNTGESSQMNCYGDGTCPSSVAGSIKKGIAFDGQTNILTLSPLVYNENSATLAFWIKVDSLPTGNERMYVIDTARSEDGTPIDGDVDVWVDSSGYLWFDIEGDVPDRASFDCYFEKFSGVGDTCNTTDSNWSQPHRSDTQLVPGSEYVHVFWSGGNHTRLYINNEIDSTYTGTNTPSLHIGEGFFGSNFTNTSGLDGSIDELVVYREVLSRETNIDRVEYVFNGNYYMIDITASSDKVPVAVYNFEEYQNIGSNFVVDTFDNAAGDPLTCISPDTCPTAVNDGFVGDAVDFDGVNDTLPINAAVASNQLNITMYIKPHTLPATGQVYFLMESAFSNGENRRPANLALNEQGKLTIIKFPNLDPAQYGREISDFDFGAALNQWTKINVALNQERVPGQSCGYILTTTINDDANNAKREYMADCESPAYLMEVGAGRLGSRLDGSSSFDGQIDEFKVTHEDYYRNQYTLYNVSFLAPEIPGFGWLDGVTAGRTAFCETIRNCPDQTSSGIYGDGIVLDGQNDYLVANAIGLDNRSFTVAGWFKRAGTGQNDYFVYQGTNAANHGLHIGFRASNQFTCAFYANDLDTAAYTDTEWHHWVCTYDADSNTRTIYRDGVQVAQDNPSSPYLGSGVIEIGKSNDNFAAGTLDDLFIIPDALDIDGITAIKAGAYPAITFPDPFVSFFAEPQSSLFVEGIAQVETQVTASQHTFDTEVDAALQIQDTIPYPVIDNNSANLKVYMPFDDVPGSTSFANIVGTNQPCGLNDPNRCPAAGLRGRVDRALYFDGTTALIGPGGIGSINAGMTIAAWVKADRGTVVSAGPMELDIGRLQVRSYCDVDASVNYRSGLVFEETSFNMPENEWVHLAATVSRNSGTARIYINGTQVKTLNTCVNNHQNNYFDSSNYSNMYIGGNNIQLGYDPLLGYLDDLRIYNAELNQTAIQNLITNSAAVMRFEFDEDDEAAVYVDATQNSYVGTPTLVTSSPAPVYDPNPGTKGQIGNTALFNGSGSIEVKDAAPNVNFNQDFTIMTWLNTTTTNVNILTETDGDTTWEAGEKAFYLDAQGRLVFSGSGNGAITSNTAVNDNLWNHVAFTWSSSGNTGRMYINGKLVGSTGSYAANQADIATNIIQIGAAAHNNGNFKGQLDELAIYQRTLTQDEMRGAYLRELIWYRDTASAIVTIDTDNPIVKFLTGNYHNNQPIDLIFSAVDASTNIQQVQFGLKAPSDSGYSWTVLEPCESQHTLYNSTIYCVEFDPSSLDGEGQYDLRLRAYDAVGNMTELPEAVYVDDGAPVVTVPDYGGDLIPATQADPESSVWTINIAGTASDPVLNGGFFPGSGLLLTTTTSSQTVAVTLYDHRQRPAGAGTQLTTLNPDGSWSIDYRFVGTPPQGSYMVEALVQDQVGNQSAAFSPDELFILAFGLDEQPAQPEINLWNIPDTITDTTVISGTVVDQIDPASAVVQYRFEEAAGTTIFYDSSYDNQHGLCTDCPTAGLTGQFGNAVQFNGGTQYISVTNSLNPISTTFSVAAWVNPSSLGAAQTLLSQQDGNGSGTDWLWIDTSGQLHSSLGNVALNTTTQLSSGQWNHVALTYDGTDLRLYINGELEATAAANMTAADGDWIIGLSQDLSTAPFTGLLDELMISDRPLSEAVIEALAVDHVIGVEGVDVWLEPFSFTDTLAIPSWVDTTLLGNTGDNLAQWQYAIPTDVEGFYRLHLQAADLFGNNSGPRTVWNGIIDTAAPTIQFDARIIGVGEISDYQYTYTISDFILDASTIVHPCDDADLTYSYYDVPDLPHDGLPYEVSGTCRVFAGTVDESVSPVVTVGACDAFGHCSEESKQATGLGATAVIIYTPENRSQAPLTSPFTISGGIAGVEEYALTMTVSVNGVVIDNFVPPNPAFGDWSTEAWMPDAPGTYTITVEADMSGGLPVSDTVIVTLLAAGDAPTAVDDLATTVEETAVTVDVLANDFDVDDDLISLIGVTQPQNGTAAVSGSQVVYTPTVGFIGVDAFSYTIRDEVGFTASAMVTVTVNELVVGQVEVSVWDDQNGDGKQQNSEPLLDGITVNLLDASTNEVVTSALSSQGVATLVASAGRYRIQAVAPVGHAFTLYNEGNNENIDSDVRRNDGRSVAFDLAAYETITTLDAGLWTPATVEAEVWDDQNGDGKRQNSEPLLTEPVTVRLLDGKNNELQTTTTVAGVATFTNVPADTQVKLEFVKPTGYALTLHNEGNNENIDSDARRNNGRTHSFKSTKGAELITDVDAGFWAPATVQAEVWDDQNGDGKKQNAEPLILVPVTVNLLDGRNGLLQTTTTVDGVATFSGIPADTDVKLEFIVPDGYALTLYNQGDNENIDSDARQNNGRTAPFKSSKGSELMTYVDAGFWSPATVQAEVWDDLNGDGKKQNSEPLLLIPVTVNLLDSGNNFITTTTSVDGMVTFSGISAATNVKLEFVVPEGYALTLYNQGSNENIDSDARRNNGRTDPFQSSQGSELITHIDAGFWSPGQVETEVWDDQNGDGKRQNSEPPLGGVVVSLLYADNSLVLNPSSGLPVTGTSDVAGIALLSYVPADTDVKLEFVTPEGHALTLYNQGGNENIDSDARRSNGRTDTFKTTMGGQVITDMDAGFWAPATIQAEIWDDLNGDGKKQNAEPLLLIPVTVNLLDGGNNLLQTTLSVDGIATFTEVPADMDVKLEFVLPTGYTFTLYNQGNNENIDSDARQNNGRTDTFKSTKGSELMTHMDAGMSSPG